jgi:small basic protein
MKKAIVIIALVAMIIVPVAAKSILPDSNKGGFAIGIELGEPTGITFDYKIDSKWDGYITAAFGFGSNSGYIDAVLGGQYKVTDFKIDKAKFDVNVGVQAGALIYLGDASGIAIAARGTGSISYDWTWKNVGKFTAYLRAGVGYAIGLSESVSGGVTFNAALGCVYHL